MLKKIFVIASVLCLNVVVSSCQSGNTTSVPSISAEVTSGTCTNMTNNQSCSITITYNVNGTDTSTLQATPNPLPEGVVANDTFYSTFNTCSSQIPGNQSGTCTIVITYTSQGGDGTNTNLAFVLGMTTSNSIPVTGN